MNAKRKSESEVLEQPAEAREANLSRTSAGSASASGQAAKILREGEPERPENEGSTLPVAGDPTPDWDGPQVATGAQAVEAAYATNGTIPAGMTASPTGFVPASTVSSDPAEAQRIAQENLDNSAHKAAVGSEPKWLSRSEVEAHSGAELRAVASDRGYDIPSTLGNRGTRRAFLKAQAKDREEYDAEAEDEDSGETE